MWWKRVRELIFRKRKDTIYLKMWSVIINKMSHIVKYYRQLNPKRDEVQMTQKEGDDDFKTNVVNGNHHSSRRTWKKLLVSLYRCSTRI